MRLVQYAGPCIVSNVQLHHDSHSQILTAMETPSASTLADPTWFVCHLLIDRHDFSYLLHEHCRVTSLQIIQFPCISWMALVKLEIMPSGLSPLFFICFSYPCHLLLLKLGFSTKLHLHCLHLTRVCGLCHHPPLSNPGNVSGHHLAGSNKTGCWSSFDILSQAFHQSNFAILAICPHTLADCVLWSGPETQLCIRVHLPPLAGSSTTVHSSMILQNAPPCYVCAHQVTSV